MKLNDQSCRDSNGGSMQTTCQQASGCSAKWKTNEETIRLQMVILSVIQVIKEDRNLEWVST